MKKALYSICFTSLLVWTVIFIYHLITFPCLIGIHYSVSFVMSLIFGILTIVLEDRPMITRKQKDYNYKVEMTGVLLILAIVVLCILYYLITLNQ